MTNHLDTCPPDCISLINGPAHSGQLPIFLPREAGPAASHSAGKTKARINELKIPACSASLDQTPPNCPRRRHQP